MTALNIDIKLRRGDFDLDVQLETNQRVTGLVGRSGAGKSTLLHALCGLVKPDSGKIAIGDRVLFDSANGINLPPNKRGVGVVFQDLRLFPHRTVDGNLRFGDARARGRNTDNITFDPVVKLLELGSLLQKKPDRLSGGERQRVALGRALLSGPDLLLFDEPLAALDQRLKSQIIPLLRRVRDELALPMLYVCHDLAELQMMTDTAIVMASGRAAGCGALRSLAHAAESFDAVHDLGLVNVLRCVVRERRIDDGFAVLEVARHENSSEATTNIRAPLTNHQAGETVRIIIRPQDIALASAPIDGISIQNQLIGPITNISQHGGRVLVEVDLGQPALIEITPRASQSLGLGFGNKICCLIKSSAIEVVT